MRALLLGCVFAAALVSSACEGPTNADDMDEVGADNASGTDGPCEPGTLECECEGLGICDDGLTCDVWDRCVPVGTETGFAEDGFNADGSCNPDVIGCSEMAACVVVDGEPTCECNEGWEGSGELCLEVESF